MDWGTIAVVVGANAIISAIALGIGLWFVGSRLSALTTVTQEDEPRLEPVPAGDATLASRPAPKPQAEAPAKRSKPPANKRASRGRRGTLRDHLAPIGGMPGSITEDQQDAVLGLLGRSAQVEWMSEPQAETLLAAQDYSEAVVDSRIGSRDEFPGRRKIVRRMALTIVGDERARNFVIDWAAGRFDGDDDTTPVDPLEEEIWAWVQQHAARLLEAEGRHVEAA